MIQARKERCEQQKGRKRKGDRGLKPEKNDSLRSVINSSDFRRKQEMC